MSQRTKPIWDFFCKVDGNASKAKCCECNKLLSLDNDKPLKQTIHGLKYHLENAIKSCSAKIFFFVLFFVFGRKKVFFFVFVFVYGRKINCFFGRFYFSAENGKSIFGRSLAYVTSNTGLLYCVYDLHTIFELLFYCTLIVTYLLTYFVK